VRFFALAGLEARIEIPRTSAIRQITGNVFEFTLCLTFRAGGRRSRGRKRGAAVGTLPISLVASRAGRALFFFYHVVILLRPIS